MASFVLRLLHWITQARKATHFTAYGHVIGAGNLEIYVTPAGKTSYITDIQTAVSDPTASWGGKIELRNAGDAVVHSINHMAEGTALSGAPVTIFHKFQLPMILPAGYDVNLHTNAGTTAYDVAISGWVE